VTLATGTRFGQLEIVGLLGVGGMGEVYRARDERLEREVAIKVLPDELAADADRVARFRREAQALAALNHPNIAAIYGLEESAGRQALILELVEGPTLAEWITARGRHHSPLDETLAVARQIAEALDAAHERGIVHRDLKPANIKISNDGRVKVLDFGIAKMHTAVTADPLPRTVTSAATGVGVVLGTVAYMSPEQARGNLVDRRTDIWAFGCILFELLAFERAFPSGETASDTLAHVLIGEPEWSALPASTPTRLRALLERCLRKEPKHRLRDIGDALADLDYATYQMEAATPPVRSRQREYTWAAIAVTAIGAAGVTAWATWRPPPPGLPIAFTVEAPQRGQLNVGEPLSPDGRMLAFAAPSRDGVPMIFVRRLDSLAVEALTGTEGAAEVFWSPDSQHLGFVADGRLKRIPVRGGSAQVLCVLPDALGTNGGSWSPNGTILLGTRGALLRIPADGGEPVAASEVDLAAHEQWHTAPVFLPDGRHFLFNVLSGGFTERQAYVGTLDSMERQPLGGVRSPARYAATGHVLFYRGSTLVAQRFDTNRLELIGEAFETADRVAGINTAPFSVSADGTLAYLASPDTETELQWFDRSGTPLGVAGPRGRYLNPELSRDGTRIAIDRERQGNVDIYVLDLARGVTERITTHTAAEFAPVWSPTSEAVMFTSYRGGTGRIYRRDFGAAEDGLVQDSATEQRLNDWSSDGRYVVYAQEEPAGPERAAHEDLWALELGSQSSPIRLTDTLADDINARISPNGRWLAYASNESGAQEIYLQAFPRPGAKRQISAGGGLTPVWSPDGSELVYLTTEGWVMAAAVASSGTNLELSAPTRLFHADLAFTGVGRILSVAPDGRILLNVIPADRAPPAIVVVHDWVAGLARR
jgi:Tol biopolymer transport system component